jgi:osmoprotectant transport system ATP-binding protein
VIRFETVTKRYPDGTVAVDALDLEAPSGEITVLVGPSGCGKTTSLRMINRLIEPTSGRVLLDDQDTAKVKPAQLRRGMGYVIQHAGLFPHRTIVDNIATVPFLVGTDKKRARARAMELLERVGLDPAFAKRYPAQLSGGQQQRVGVARALAADPPVMLMDEPFSAVDPVVREQLQNEFLRLQAELHKTIVFVTHDIDEAIKLGDRVAVMRAGGKLAQFAPPAELLARPADAFVAGFVGRDRGYRALGFAEAGALPLSGERPVRLGERVGTARDRAEDDWALVVDSEERPLGWLAVGRLPHDALDSEITPDLLNLGGTLPRVGHAARRAGRRALLAERPRCHRARRRDVRRHGECVAGGRPHRGARRRHPRGRRRGRRGRARRGGLVMGSVWQYFTDHHSEIAHWTWTTIWLAAVPLVVGLAISLPIGWLASRYHWTYLPIVSGSGLLYTIPSIVLLLLLPGLIGTRILDPINVAIALTIYTVALLARVVADALSSVSAETMSAAAAMGYTSFQRLIKVQLSIAVPVIGAGLRVAAVSNVSLVSVASIIGVSQLGQLFVEGNTLVQIPPTLLGLILFVVLALIFDAVILVLVWLLTPWRRAVPS